MVLRNGTRGGGGALRVIPRGTGNDPVGTVVSAFYADGGVQTQRYGSAHTTRYSQGLVPLHFGIPVGDAIEQLLVRWPGGHRQLREVGQGEELIEVSR